MISSKADPGRRMLLRVRCCQVLWLVVCALAANFVHAQPPGFLNTPGASSPSTESETSLEQLDATITDIESNSEMDEMVRTEAIETYRAARSDLETAKKHKEAVAAVQATVGLAPVILAELRRSLAVPLNEAKAEALRDLPEDGDLAELEQLLTKAQTDLAVAGTDRTIYEQELQALRVRPGETRERIAQLRQRQSQISQELTLPASPEQPMVLQNAYSARLLAESKAVEAEIVMLEQELETVDLRAQLLSAQADFASREVAIFDAREQVLEKLVNRRKREQVEQAQVQAEMEKLQALRMHPAVGKLAEQTGQLSEELASVVSEEQRIQDDLRKSTKLREQIDHDFQVAQQRLDIAGLSEVMGQILPQQRENLPDLRRYKRDLSTRQDTLTEIGLSQIRTSEQRFRVADTQARVDQLMAEEVDSSLPEREREEIRGQLRHALESQQSRLDQLDIAYASYLRALGDLDFAQRQVVDTAETFSAFIDEHLLWIPSTATVSLETLRDLGPSIAYFLSPPRWVQVGRTLLAQMREVLPLTALAMVAFLGLLVLRPRLVRRLIHIGERCGHLHTDRITLTIRAVLLTVLLALPWPLLVHFLGWILQSDEDASAFTTAVGAGLVEVAELMFWTFTILVVCRPGGLAHEHFEWKEHNRTLIRRWLFLTLAVVLPCDFINVTLRAAGDETAYFSLGRLVGFITLFMWLVFLYRIFNPRNGVTAETVAEKPDHWLARFRYVWYPALIAAPIALIVLSVLGYKYTAESLGEGVALTLFLIVGGLLLHDFALRWLAVTQRRMAWKKAREELRVEMASRAAGASGAGEDGHQVKLDEHAIDFATIDAQTRHLLRVFVGIVVLVPLWLTWSDVLPALGILTNIELWQNITTIDGQKVTQAVTLADLAIAVGIGALIVIAARNVPGLLEILVLQRLPLDAGLRYAISSIAQYVIVGIGIVFTFNTVGIGWSQVQWLAAALSVGLGFGLQEVFANFVSGLIILFERPVRVGDTVTVGGLTGTVSRIRIRATTITDWDNKEIVVPNKTFITSEITNWTLSDPIVRVVMKVGIAYGSDTELAHRLMRETAAASAKVLNRPSPNVYFMGLGDSSLDFEVRVYVSTIDDWLPVMHEFHMEIVKALEEHGIQIPFPQRDIHVRSVQPISATESGNRSQPETLEAAFGAQAVKQS